MSEHIDTTADMNQSTTPQTPPASGRRLTRRHEGKVVAGVASGLGDYFNVDPVLFRILFVVLAVAGGAGVLLYALAWVLIPSTSAAESVGERALGRAGARITTVFGIALLAVGAVWIVSGAGFWDPGIVWAVALIAIGVILLREDETEPPHARATARPPAPAAEGAQSVPTTAIAPPPATSVATKPKSKSYLGRLTIGIALLLLGATSVLDNLGAFDASIEDYIALAVITVGAGLIVGAWRGRSRGLLALGILLLPPLFVASLVDVPLRGGVGDRIYRPLTATAESGEYRLGAGELRIDLTSLSSVTDPIDIEASIGAGTITVLVPEGRRVTVDGHAGAGALRVFGRSDDGVDVDVEHATGNDTSLGEITLDIQVGLGEAIVERR